MIKIKIIKLNAAVVLIFCCILFYNCNSQKKYISKFEINIQDSIILDKINPNYSFLHLINSKEDFILVDNRPNIVIYNLTTGKQKYLKSDITNSHIYLTGFLPLDTSFNQFLCSYSSAYFGGYKQKAYGIFDFKNQKLIQGYYIEQSNFLTKRNDSLLEYRYSDDFNYRFFKPFFNKPAKYTISPVVRYSEKNLDSLKPFPNAGNMVKLYPFESRLKPEYFGFKHYADKKDSFIFPVYRLPCGFSDSQFTFLSYGQNNIISKINNLTNEINNIDASVDFLPKMNFLNESYDDDQYQEYFVQYTSLHYNPLTKQYYRLVRLPKKKTDVIGNYKWPHGIIIMDDLLKPIGFGLLPMGCDQIVLTTKGIYTIDQAYTRRNAKIKLYKIEIKNSKKELEIEPYTNADPNLTNTAIIDSSKFNSYLRLLGCKNQNSKSIIVPLLNSCPSCLVKVAPILTDAKRDTSINIIILANNKESVDKFLKEKNIRLGPFVFADYTWQFENYLPSLFNINASIMIDDKVNIQRYDPNNLYDIIINLGIKSNLKKPGPQCYPVEK